MGAIQKLQTPYRSRDYDTGRLIDLKTGGSAALAPTGKAAATNRKRSASARLSGSSGLLERAAASTAAAPAPAGKAAGISRKRSASARLAGSSGLLEQATSNTRSKEEVAKSIISVLPGMQSFQTGKSSSSATKSPAQLVSESVNSLRGSSLMRDAQSASGEKPEFKTFSTSGVANDYDSTSGGSKSISEQMDELRKQRDEVQESLSFAKQQINALSRAHLSDKANKYRREADSYERQLEELEENYNNLLNEYYRVENEEKRASIQKDPAMRAQYQSAQSIQEDMDKVSALMAYVKSGSGDAAQVEGYKQYLFDTYGLDQKAVDQYAIAGSGGAYVPRTDGGYNNLYELYEELESKKNEAVKNLDSGGYNYERMEEYSQMLQDAAQYQKKMAEWAEYADEHPVLSSVDSILTSPFQGIDYLKTMAGGIGKSDIDNPETYVPMNVYNMDATNFVSQVRGTVSKKIEENTDWEIFGQNVASFLYQTGMSIADSGLQVGTSAALGVPTAAAYFMGASAASNQARDVIQRGGTNKQAFWGGLAAGAAEVVFEKVSIDHLLKTKSITGWKSFLTETLKHSGVNASEEFLTEVANILSDAAIMVEKSNFQLMVNNYLSQGMSETEAKKRAYLDCVGQVALAGAGGFLSGIAMGGAVNAYNLYTGSYTGFQNSGSGSTSVGKQASASRQSDAARAILEAAGQQNTRPGGAIGAILETVGQQTDAQTSDAARAILGALNANQQTQSTAQMETTPILERAAAEHQQRGSVSNATATAILNDSTAVSRLEQSGLHLTGNMTQFQRRAAVKNAVAQMQAEPVQSNAQPVHVGQATVLQNPYDGPVPTYVKPENRSTPQITRESVQTAEQQIQSSRSSAQESGKSFRNFLSDFYENLFQKRGGAHDVVVSGLSMNGEPYTVSLNKSAVGKVISDKNMTPQKLAVFDVLDDVVQNGEYVGSNQYTQKGKQKDTIRFDLFETPVQIDGENYLVTFDVEVFPSTNNYRTHKVINEMDLVRLDSTDTGTHQPHSQTTQGPTAEAAPDGRATQTGAFDTVATSASQDQTGQSTSVLDSILPQSAPENNQNSAQTGGAVQAILEAAGQQSTRSGGAVGAIMEAAGQRSTRPGGAVQAILDAAGQQNTRSGGAVQAILEALGQKNTADTTPAVNENGLIALSELEQINLSSGKRNKIVSTFQDAAAFIRNALSNKQGNERAYLGKVPPETAAMVLDQTGIDISNYNAILPSDAVRHMFKKHGNTKSEADRGQVALTPETAANISSVLSNPDMVSLSRKTDAKGNLVLIFKKQIGDNYATAQAVADGTKSLITDTLYIRKQKNPQAGYNADTGVSPAHNARSVLPQDSSN